MPADDFGQEEARENRRMLIDYGRQYEGVPYKYGGTDPDGMDCSGFIFTTAQNAIGLRLPRTVAALYDFARIIPDDKKEPGDILFFKTVGSRMSHAGIYLGNNQFIHSASDGPSTGVIVSSLNESYWKRTYAGVGQILPSGGEWNGQDSGLGEADSVPVSADAGSPGGETGNPFWSHISTDMSLAFDWNVGANGRPVFNARGFTLDFHMRYDKRAVKPGIGFNLTYDHTMRIFQIPLFFSISVPYGFRFYMGPSFTIGSPVQPGTKDRASASIFPGVLGVSWETPRLRAGKIDISFVQDIRYTVFNNLSGGALPMGRSLSAGLVFSTGIRVTLPVSRFL